LSQRAFPDFPDVFQMSQARLSEYLPKVAARLRSRECAEEYLAIFWSGINTESFRKDGSKKM